MNITDLMDELGIGFEDISVITEDLGDCEEEIVYEGEQYEVE